MGAAIKHFIIPIVPGTVSAPRALYRTLYNIIRRRVVRAARPIGPGRKLPLYPAHHILPLNSQPLRSVPFNAPPLGLIHTYTRTMHVRTALGPQTTDANRRIYIQIRYSIIIIIVHTTIPLLSLLPLPRYYTYISNYYYCNHYTRRIASWICILTTYIT